MTHILNGKEVRSIYLAGRIRSPYTTDYRSQLLRSHVLDGGGGEVWWDGEKEPREADSSWLFSRDAIDVEGFVFDYAGPYVIRCDHACYHRVPHVWSDNVCGTSKPYPEVALLCQDAIRRCDLVFAWIEDVECYGTLNEIGFASALGKTIVIAGPKCFEELWFTYQCAYKVDFYYKSARKHFMNLVIADEGMSWREYIRERYKDEW